MCDQSKLNIRSHPVKEIQGLLIGRFFLLFLFLLLVSVILSVVLFCRSEPPTTYWMYGTTQDALFRS